MRYGSVCSGIEAATAAWHPLGWEPAFFSEIEPFPCAVLAHHHPHVPNHGDMTKFQEWPDHAIDLLVGGTPCQSFSVAGLRAGLADPRGNLMLTYLAIAARYRPRWLVWENVPGVLSSNGGRDFAALLGGLGELGYGFAYRVLDAQFCRAHGFSRAVPQRRRRVFVVGHLGDWRRAAAVLFDGASLRGDPPPRREAGQGIATTISARPTGGGGLGTDFDLDGGLIAKDVAPTLNAAFGSKPGLENQHIDSGMGMFVAHTLRAEGFDASEDGTGRGTPLIAFDTTQVTSKANRSNPQPGDPSHPLAAGAHAAAIAFQSKASPSNSMNPSTISPTLDKGKSDGVAIAFDAYNQSASDVSHPLRVGLGTGLGDEIPQVLHGWAVRRLTPTECERLQGFPDGHTAVPYRGKPAADGPRYKALGNSMAVNVMRVLGERIALIEDAA